MIQPDKLRYAVSAVISRLLWLLLPMMMMELLLRVSCFSLPPFTQLHSVFIRYLFTSGSCVRLLCRGVSLSESACAYFCQREIFFFFFWFTLSCEVVKYYYIIYSQISPYPFIVWMNTKNNIVYWNAVIPFSTCSVFFSLLFIQLFLLCVRLNFISMVFSRQFYCSLTGTVVQIARRN